MILRIQLSTPHIVIFDFVRFNFNEIASICFVITHSQSVAHTPYTYDFLPYVNKHKNHRFRFTHEYLWFVTYIGKHIDLSKTQRVTKRPTTTKKNSDCINRTKSSLAERNFFERKKLNEKSSQISVTIALCISRSTHILYLPTESDFHFLRRKVTEKNECVHVLSLRYTEINVNLMVIFFALGRFANEATVV